MTDNSSDTASCGYPYKVAIMPTEDGNKVLLILRADQADQAIYWLDTTDAKNLSEALIVMACRIEDEGTDRPPMKN